MVIKNGTLNLDRYKIEKSIFYKIKYTMDTNIVFSLIVIILFIVIISLIVYCIIIRCNCNDESTISRENSIINDILTRNDFPRTTEIVEI
jgi:hypothetical protein